MFAARSNQENVIYEQQTAAAAKSLNQGAKTLPPKTPANKVPKTPFRVPLNDENALFGAGKTGGKGKQDGMLGEGKGANVDKNAFVTPAGLRNRAPLGNKTTNAKATALQTPAAATQEKQPAKHTSPRMRRAKIKVHEAETEAVESEDDLPDIEYMPSREVPLPDYPDDWPHDRTYPQFEGNNLTRGWWSEFAGQKDDDDDTEFSDFEEKLKLAKRYEKERQGTQQSAKKSSTAKNVGLQKTTKNPLVTRQPLTLTSKSAASALSNPAGITRTPSFAAPTVATKSRLPSALTAKKATSNGQVATGNPRHGAARIASNTTLGYSKGRAVSASSRKTASQAPTPENGLANVRVHSPVKTSLDDLFEMTHTLRIHQDGSENAGGDGTDLGEDDDELDYFQLEPMGL